MKPSQVIRPSNGFRQSFGLIVGFLPWLLGSLAVTYVVTDASGYEVQPFLDQLLYKYNQISLILLYWMYPVIVIVADTINYIFGIKLGIYDHWRHVILIVALYYTRDIINFVNSRDWKSLVPIFLNSIFGIFFTTLLVGSISGISDPADTLIEDLYESVKANGSLCAVYAFYSTIRGLILAPQRRYQVIDDPQNPRFSFTLKMRVFGSVRDACVGFLVGNTIAIVLVAARVPSPALGSCMALVFLFSLFHLSKGWTRSKQIEHLGKFVQTDDSALQKFLSHGNAQLGLGMFGLFFGTACLVAMDAIIATVPLP